MPSGYGIQLRMEGAASIQDNWIRLVAPTGAVRTFQGEADAWDLMARAGLATCIGKGAWELVSESRPARIAPLLGMTRDESLLNTTPRAFRDTLRVDLGVPLRTNLKRSWLVLTMAWPIDGVLPTYVIHTASPLDGSSSRWDAKQPPEARCRD